MKGIKRDDDGKVVVPEGMVYIKEHLSAGKGGVDAEKVMVCEHYRFKKRKKAAKKSF